MIIDGFCENMTDKIKKKCYKCRNLGIASHFEANVNHYAFCCVSLGKRISEDLTDCPFTEKEVKDIRKDFELQCALHGIPVPDWVREL